jgi:release factor glutamine methyltransferase
MTTIREALVATTEQLTRDRQARHLPIETPRREAEILLCAVLDRERSYLYTYPDQELDRVQQTRWQDFLARRLQDEPVAYILGQQEFYGLDFVVDRRVLIPRPETEMLVETALAICHAHLDRGQIPLLADIGTGSGAIPISIAVSEPHLPLIYATDISSDALAVARVNSQHHNVTGRIQFLQGDLLSPLPEAVDLLLANLPYVGTSEQKDMLPNVLNYEPHLALFSGYEGLDLLEQLLQQAARSDKLRARADLLLEIGYQQREPLIGLAREIWPQARITCLRDYAGWDRILHIVLDSPEEKN